MVKRHRLVRGLATIGGALALLFGGLVVPAAAEPDTPVVYPSGSSGTRASRLAFDTCTAPSLSALAAWKGSSPYKAVNIYFGGNNRGCAQPNLTKAWVSGATAAGWRLLPTYFGYQPSCMLGSKPNRYTASNATTRGTSDATDAVTRAKALGLLPGSALYADVEHYRRTNTSCRTAVRRYVSAWTKTLHRSGYLSGVYVHQNSGLRDLSDSYNWSSYARPDAVWMARWDGSKALTGWPTAPNSHWAVWQRAKQYRGDHDETWGGVTINIDSDVLRAPVATVARTYRVTSSTALNARTGPGTSYAKKGSPLPRGALATVECQKAGSKVGTTRVWNRLRDGRWVSDYYVSNRSNSSWSRPVPRCF